MEKERNTVRKSKSGNRLVTIPTRFVPRFWQDSDNRIAIVKTIRRRYQALKEDCGGGETIQRDLLCQRIAFLSIILETQEVCGAEEGFLDLGTYTQAVNSLQGLLKTVGLEKRIKNVTDLQSYLKEKTR